MPRAKGGKKKDNTGLEESMASVKVSEEAAKPAPAPGEPQPSSSTSSVAEESILGTGPHKKNNRRRKGKNAGRGEPGGDCQEIGPEDSSGKTVPGLSEFPSIVSAGIRPARSPFQGQATGTDPQLLMAAPNAPQFSRPQRPQFPGQQHLPQSSFGPQQQRFPGLPQQPQQGLQQQYQARPQQQQPPAQARPQQQQPPAQARPQQQQPPAQARPQQQQPPAQARPQQQQPPAQARPQQQQPPAQARPQQQQPPAQARPQQQQPPAQARPPMEGGSRAIMIPDRIRAKKLSGVPIKVLVNYLQMDIKPIKVHRYDFSITPDRPKKIVPRVFKLIMTKNFPKTMHAFDQVKNFYTIQPLNGVTTTEKFTTAVEIADDNGKVMKFEVSIKGTGIVDLGTITNYMKNRGSALSPPSEAIQCVDVILRQGTLENYVKAGRTFFKRPSNPVDLGDGLEMWTGLFQSAIFTSRPYINIDVAHKGFPIAQPVINILQMLRLAPKRLETQQNYDRFQAFIKGLKVMVNLAGSTHRREYIVNDVADPPNRIFFNKTEGNKEVKMSVADYFQKEKNCRLQFPDLNCLWVGPRDKKIYYPIEFCEVSYGQVRNKQLNPFQLRIMVKEAATKPDVRMSKIKEVIQDMQYSRNQTFKSFGLDISDEFTKVNARILDPPQIQSGDSNSCRPARGAWNTNRMHQGSDIAHWGILGVGVNDQQVRLTELIKMFRSVGHDMGINLSDPPTYVALGKRTNELNHCMQDALHKKLQMLIVIVSTRMPDVYSQVKKMAELNVGMLTQCIKDTTLMKSMNRMTIRNILLKVNSKMMGVNHALAPPSSVLRLAGGPYMLVGADVTHPSPDQSNIPSIAAVTASFDKQGYKYNVEFSIQSPKRENIHQFEDMMVDHFLLFRKKNNVLPKKIFMFRDGVSEGQFNELLSTELRATYNAYARVSGNDIKPEVLLVVVQKRHHTRFFLERSRNNVEPGTIVDENIVHQRELDYYLVSHQAILGTARPTRYYVVANDSHFCDDDIEKLTYDLCHLFSRCTRAVSYPTPTYYAHLACERARSLTHGEKFDNEKLIKNPQRFHIKNSIKDNNQMFFV